MSATAKTAAAAEKTATPVQVTPARVPSLMRKCSCGSSSPSGCGGKCADDEAKKKMQRKAATPSPAPVSVPPIVGSVLGSPGRPLDSSTRGFMESRFGHDFSGVRVHTGGDAAESARAVGAHAYTVGNDIVFDHGKYDPHSEAGRHLLAHELTHTIQQRGMGRMANESLGETSAGDAYESEADSIASRVLSGGGGANTPHAHAHGPMIARASVTGSAKPQPASNPNKAQLDAIGLEEADPVPGQDPAVHRRFHSKEKFPLPPIKGPRSFPLWDAKAKAGALESTIDISGSGQPSTGLKQLRPDTKQLRKIWLEKVGWDPDDAPKLWKGAGGDTESFDPPKAGGKTCDMDHIVELQVGGSNVPENMQPLDASENRESGGEVRGILADKAKAVRTIYPGLEYVTLHYSEVDPAGAGKCLGPCCEVEMNAFDPQKAAAPTEEGAPYPISVGGSNATLRVPKDAKKTVPLFGSAIVANDAGATIIPGMLLHTLNLKKGDDTITAKLDNRPGTKLPIKPDQTAIQMNVAADGKLSVPKKTPKIGFTFPYLSTGTITKLELTDNNIAGEGTLEPSIPLLKGLKLGVRFSMNEFVITTPIPTDKLKSIPGFKIKDTSKIALELYPQFNPSGNIDFYVGSAEKPIVSGSVTLAAPNGEFTATGTLNATLPGFDTATGTVLYKRSEGWSGSLSVSSSKIPGAKNIAVTVGLSEKGYTVSGDLLVGLPTGDEVKLEVRQSPGNRPVYRGRATVTIRPLKPVNLAFESDGHNLTATGDTKFELLGATGTIAVMYKNGVVTGTGTLAFQKGKASGSLSVTLTPKRKFTGEGKLSYQVTPSLMAEAGAILDENEKLTVKGALVFTKPIPLFKPSGGSKEFFDFGLRIPVPGASIGPIGIQAKVGAKLTGAYKFGPGELQNVRIEATFDPLEENVDPKLTFSGRLYIGASVTVSGEFYGSISLDLLVAEVAGGISVIPSATLEGAFTADVLAKYAAGDYSVDAALAVELALKLGLALTAWVKAKAGISIFSVTTRKDWTLASFSYDTGLKLAVKAPIRYSSKEPFQLPSVDQITIVRPDINIQKMLEGIFGRARSEEKEV